MSFGGPGAPPVDLGSLLANTSMSVVSGGFIYFIVGANGGSTCSSLGWDVTIHAVGAPAPLAITTTSLPSATWEQQYGPTRLAATGGTPPYTWSVTNGHLPTMGAFCIGPTFCYPTFDTSTGAILGIPQYVGTYSFTAVVTDSSGHTAQASLSIAVHTPPSLQQTFALAYGGGSVLVNPHVAIVLVDPNSSSWWSPGITTSSSEQATMLRAISNLVTNDYSSDYGTPLSKYYETTPSGNVLVGRPSLCSYSSGKSWYGPVPASSIPTGPLGTLLFFRLKVIPFLTSPCDRDVANTVFLLLYAPSPTCTGGSGNGTSSGIHTATVQLQDNCAFLPPSQFEPTGQGAVDFATYAASHELDEVITDPGPNRNTGWVLPSIGGQIADGCNLRNASGQTAYGPLSAYPYQNYTKDFLGTVVAAYVGNVGGAPSSGGSYPCTPDVSTGIPPG